MLSTVVDGNILASYGRDFDQFSCTFVFLYGNSKTFWHTAQALNQRVKTLVNVIEIYSVKFIRIQNFLFYQDYMILLGHQLETKSENDQ